MAESIEDISNTRLSRGILDLRLSCVSPSGSFRTDYYQRNAPWFQDTFRRGDWLKFMRNEGFFWIQMRARRGNRIRGVVMTIDVPNADLMQGAEVIVDLRHAVGKR